MLGQLNLWGKTKLEVTLDRIKQYEPPEGYYVAFSGGKDSQCIYHLCKMAGVKFDAHYRVTSVDPPELVQFIKEQYPDVAREIPRDKDGKAVTMWTLIAKATMPPTRIARYCCEQLKESGGDGRAIMTGVRWSESVNRAKNQGGVTIVGKKKTVRKELDDNGIEYRETARGGVVLNFDDATTRRAAEICFRNRKVLINPIIDWTEDDVWEFLNEVAKVPHCKLYDEGFKRLGCIGCPMQGTKGMVRDFERWPTYKRAYLRAMQKAISNHHERPGETRESLWLSKTPEEGAQAMFDWWINS